MKNNLNISILIILSLLFINSMAFSQSNTFNWDDSFFEIGDSREIYLDPYYCSRRTVDCYENNKQVYDTLVNFLKVNPNIKIEISFHSDHRGSVNYNQKLTERRAEVTKGVLLEKGVSIRQIESLGYGETMPLDTTKPEINRRIEVKIIKNEMPPYIIALEKDTSIQRLYNVQGDYFRIKKDTINNKDLDALAIFLKEVVRKDTSFFIEIYYDYHIDARKVNRYSNRPLDYGEMVRHYLLRNYNFENDIAGSSCLSRQKILYTEARSHVLIKIVLKSENLKCVEKHRAKWNSLKVNECNNCPF